MSSMGQDACTSFQPVSGLLNSTVTETIWPPVGSFTVPSTVPAPPSSWLQAGEMPRTAIVEATAKYKTVRTCAVFMNPLFKHGYQDHSTVTKGSDTCDQNWTGG